MAKFRLYTLNMIFFPFPHSPQTQVAFTLYIYIYILFFYFFILHLDLWILGMYIFISGLLDFNRWKMVTVLLFV